MGFDWGGALQAGGRSLGDIADSVARARAQRLQQQAEQAVQTSHLISQGFRPAAQVKARGAAEQSVADVGSSGLGASSFAAPSPMDEGFAGPLNGALTLMNTVAPQMKTAAAQDTSAPTVTMPGVGGAMNNVWALDPQHEPETVKARLDAEHMDRVNNNWNDRVEAQEAAREQRATAASTGAQNRAAGTLRAKYSDDPLAQGPIDTVHNDYVSALKGRMDQDKQRDPTPKPFIAADGTTWDFSTKPPTKILDEEGNKILGKVPREPRDLGDVEEARIKAENRHARQSFVRGEIAKNMAGTKDMTKAGGYSQKPMDPVSAARKAESDADQMYGPRGGSGASAAAPPPTASASRAGPAVDPGAQILQTIDLIRTGKVSLADALNHPGIPPAARAQIQAAIKTPNATRPQ